MHTKSFTTHPWKGWWLGCIWLLALTLNPFALSLARLIWRWVMPAFNQLTLAMSIELSFPKACFWQANTLQPWSVSSVRRALGSVRNCKTKHPHAPLFSGWSVTGCKADYQFWNAGFQPQGIRRVFSSVREKCQSTKRVLKIYPLHPLRFPYRVIWKVPLDCSVARLHPGTSLNIQSPAFSLTRLANEGRQCPPSTKT